MDADGTKAGYDLEMMRGGAGRGRGAGGRQRRRRARSSTSRRRSTPAPTPCWPRASSTSASCGSARSRTRCGRPATPSADPHRCGKRPERDHRTPRQGKPRRLASAVGAFPDQSDEWSGHEDAATPRRRDGRDGAGSGRGARHLRPADRPGGGRVLRPGDRRPGAGRWGGRRPRRERRPGARHRPGAPGPAGVGQGRGRRGLHATVPVYFHVVTDGATGAVTDRQVAAQIDVLNTTFGGRRGWRRHRVLVPLAGVTRTDNADWFYAGIGGTNEHTMKQTLHQGGTDALNLYSTTAGAYLGWAYLPDILTKPGQAYLDGVVFDWESIPRRLGHLRRPVRPGRDRDPRGRPLAQPRAHLLRRLQRQRRLRRRHAGPEDADAAAARRARTPARSRASTRSTTTWTTPTTPATRSSRPARRSGCATPGCTTGPSEQGLGGHTSRLVAARAATASGSPPTSTTAWSRRPKV